jgi:clan AA aspartic protease
VITGIVTASGEAIVRLTVRGPAGPARRIRAVIDTGYNGWLTLPPGHIALLGLPWKEGGQAILADGSVSTFDVYRGVVVWDGRRRLIPVDEADITPLVGMALLEGSALNMQVRVGGPVTIKPLPRRRRP